ncbi:hypothetical protein B0T24DRAFT_248631 [Lasiosphaeria ovina]|uniref:Uncharacterized protein n=1 Tax=Lasiosphaeria ovina TaxID=92902 RepID=A0AAE0KA49_9PEZI|nr:hypothetical protein B0T24DRAFT_248631 [Lasiosphaeria ovina]
MSLSWAPSSRRCRTPCYWGYKKYGLVNIALLVGLLVLIAVRQISACSMRREPTKPSGQVKRGGFWRAWALMGLAYQFLACICCSCFCLFVCFLFSFSFLIFPSRTLLRLSLSLSGCDRNLVAEPSSPGYDLIAIG